MNLRNRNKLKAFLMCYECKRYRIENRIYLIPILEDKPIKIIFKD